MSEDEKIYVVVEWDKHRYAESPVIAFRSIDSARLHIDALEELQRKHDSMKISLNSFMGLWIEANEHIPWSQEKRLMYENARNEYLALNGLTSSEYCKCRYIRDRIFEIKELKIKD